MRPRTAQRAPHRDPAREIDDVLARRVTASAARLIELIAWINPTDRRLAARETERRYALKSRLQSALVRAHAGDLDVVLDANFPGVVLLHHRALDQGASHVPLEALDPDARAWAQLQIDLGCALRVARERTPANDVTPPPRLRRAPAPGEHPGALRARARAALERYDYETAEALLREAFDRAEGSSECALALVAFLVDHLAADAEALALEARAAPEARQNPALRLRWAMAAARLGDAPRALALAHGIVNPEAAALHVTLADHHLRAGDLDDALRRVTDARRFDPARPDLARVADALARRMAEVFRAQEESLRAAFDRGDLDAADREAHALLLRWPDCASARRVAREVKEQRRAALVRAHRAAFEHALAAGELHEAARRVAALRDAGDDAVALGARVREAEARLGRERKARDEAAAAPVVALAREGRTEEAMGAFLALTEGARAVVRSAAHKTDAGEALAWCEALTREGGLAHAEAVRATVALREAAARMAEVPVEVIAAARPWEEAVYRTAETRRLVTRAAQRLSQLARDEALTAFERARALAASGRWEGALAAFEAVDAAALPSELQERLEGLTVEIEGALAYEQELKPLTENHHLRGWALAVGMLEQYQATAPMACLGRRLAERCERLVAEVRARWHVAVVTEGDAGRRPTDALALEGGIADTQPDARWTSVEAHGKLLFVRVYDTDAGRTVTRACVPLPSRFDRFEAHVHGGALTVTSFRGAMLTLDLDRGEVGRWFEFSHHTRGEGKMTGHSLISARTGGFWVSTWLSQRTFRYQRFDLGGLLVTAELPSATLAILSRGSAAEGQILTLDPTSNRWRISSPEGRLLDVWSSEHEPTMVAFAQHPTRASWLMLGCEGNLRFEGDTGALSLYEHHLGRASVRVLDLVAHESGATRASLYTCAEERTAWVVIPLNHGGQLLVCVDLRGGDPREAWRAEVPGRATCVPVHGGRRMLLAVESPGGVLTVELGVQGAPALGATAPSHRAKFRAACRVPGGASHLGALQRIYTRRERDEITALNARSVRPDLLARALVSEANVVCVASHLQGMHQFDALKDLIELADARYGDAPLVRMFKLELAWRAGDWERCLREVDALHAATSRQAHALEPKDRAHVAHIHGMALMQLGDFDAARDAWASGLAHDACACGLEALVRFVGASDAAPFASPLQRLRAAIDAADRHLAAGAPAAARDALEQSGVLGLAEVQSTARMVEACLALADDSLAGRFEALATFARFDGIVLRPEDHLDHLDLSLGEARWDAARLEALAARARAVLDLCALNFGPRA